ncbi:hypothetical protein KW791_03510 [Candidatus Parcubacteria bacterium]|nr:hypothetical protein [Candidatus Parcubacteria bacterium]
MQIPVFPNWYPYNDMLLDGRLDIGQKSVKTRSYDWNYRGPVLLYNSLRREPLAMRAYGYGPNKNNHRMIVGMAHLTEVRLLTRGEIRKMICNFNNINKGELEKLIKKFKLADYPQWIHNYGSYISPFQFGYFFENPTRFEKPVPFNWPSGPVKPIYIHPARYPRLYEQLLTAQVNLARSA